MALPEIRGRSPNPKCSLCKDSSTRTPECQFAGAQSFPVWSMFVQWLQAEEQARLLAIESLKEHMNQAIARLTVQVDEAMLSLQDASVVLSNGASHVENINKALQDADQLRETLGRLDVEHTKQAHRLNVVERGLEKLSALQVDGVARQAASLSETAISLGARIDSVVEEHRRLDTAMADVAKLGLVAAQVARQRPSVQPPRLSRLGSQASSQSLGTFGEASQEGSRAPSLATHGSVSSPTPRSRTPAALQAADKASAQLVGAPVAPEQQTGTPRIDEPPPRNRAFSPPFAASPGSRRTLSPSFPGNSPFVFLNNGCRATQRTSLVPQQGLHQVFAQAAATAAAAVPSGVVQMQRRQTETTQPRTDVSPTQACRRQCL